MGQFKYEDAHRELSRLVRRHPRNPELQVDLAIATLNRQQEGDEETALKMLGRVLQREPEHQRAHYCSGLLELNEGYANRALPHFRQVAEADPTEAYAAYYLALSLAQQSQHEASLQWYRRAIARDAHLRSAYYGAFQVLRRLRRAGEAREMLDLYQRLATNPRARNAEFKYTHMGSKAEIRALVAAPLKQHPPPSGPLFSKRQSLPVKAMKNVAWQSPERANLTTADINADGYLDLFAAGVLDDVDTSNAVLLGNNGGGFTLRSDHVLAGIRRINAALWGDMDNDGLLDVYFCRLGRNQLWRQKMPGVWQDITTPSTAGGDYDTVDGALFDADHDGDLDLFLVNSDGPNELLNNNRNGTYRPLAEEQGIAGRGQGARSILVVDLDQDRDADILIFNDQPPHEVYLNDLLWNYRPAPGFDALNAYPVVAALADDRDADGQPEIYTLSTGGAVSRWQADAKGQWRETRLSLAGQDSREPAPGPGPSLALADVDGDAATELFRSTPNGWDLYAFHGDKISLLAGAGLPGLRHWIPFTGDPGRGPAIVGLKRSSGFLIWPPGPGRHPFIGLQLSGMEEKDKSMRSNASGIGAHLALRSGSRWTVADTFRSHTGPGQSLQPLIIGLGGAGNADFVAIEWSDGVFQSELDLEPGRLHTITETQRQLSSCPVLFAWNGARYQFVSDLLGVAGIGFAIGRGEYAEPRPRESLQMPDGLLQPRGGRYLLKLTEPMEEAAYLDAARLTAYDLPPGWRLVLDERMSINGPEVTGEARFYRNEMLPSRVRNQRGEEVTAAVTSADLQAAPVADLDPRFIGRLLGEHSLILEFPRPLDGSAGDPMLVIDGWVEYPYSQTMFAAWQADADYRAPSLDIEGEDGRWRPFLEQFGYPAGMPRRMSLPLSGLPPGVTRLRLRTNQEIYWDRIAVAYAEPLPDVKRHHLPLRRARVQSIGFPLRTTGAQRLPHYDYDRRHPFWDTRHMAGFYTEFGAAQALVSKTDDALAIFGPGEEIHLEFEIPVQAPPAGWSRSFVFESNGWAKDMDLFTKHGATLAPLPTRGGSANQHDLLHARFNTRYESGK
ncbi:MAG: hypothetical protein GY794_05265 [bacterium]|nr:hypothetical protein [bacterium]